jgi:hypothetical protein
MPIEILAVIVLVCIAAWGLIGLLRSRWWRVVAGVGMVAGLGAFAVSAYHLWLPGAQRPPPDDRPIQVRRDGYVSSGACKACHPANYASWYATWHRTMTQTVRPDTLMAPVEDIVHRLRGKRYRLYRRDDQMWAEIPAGQHGTEQSASVQVPIVMSTGSHHMQVYWYAAGRGRVLGQYPLIYVKEAKRWIPRTAGFLMPPTASVSEETGRWNATCVKCHTTHGRPRTVALVSDATGGHVDSDAVEFGIACEACHGPGGRHAKDNRSIVRRYAAHLGVRSDDTMVNPRKLPAERSAQVCGQCHSVSAAKDPHIGRRIQHEGPLFRPGAELTDTRRIVRPKDSLDDPWIADRVERNPEFLRARFWSDGIVRVAGREYNGLVESPCYRHGDESRGVLTCLSCHRLHKDEDDPRPARDWANDLLDVGMRGNGACLQCHDELSDATALVAHTHHDGESSGSVCYNCHMPYTTYGLLNAMRSHTIRSPSVKETMDTGRLNGCNGCHLDKSLRWSAERLGDWYGIETPLTERDDEDVSAAVVALLAGDAGQRALVAWAMGWQPAMDVSGPRWRERFLAVLLTDAYDAVRFMAHRSLLKQPGYEDVVYDFLAPEEARAEAAAAVLARWRNVTGAESEALAAEHHRLLTRRDRRPLMLAE